MLIVLLWMVVDFENATSEVQRDRQTENWSRLSVALHILLPVAGLAIFLKQKHLLSRLLLQLDRNCVSIFCPSFSRREKLLKWAGSRLPETWSSQSRTLSGGISELWTDGSLLCTLINSAIPGACLNPHRHWKKPPLHGQALAYKYLGVVPVFTEKDLSGELTITQERNFIHYLNEIQQAIFRLAERNELNRTTSGLYIARGMGLYTGEQHRKTIFYVYPNTKQICNKSNIIIHIRGPYATYGKAIIPKFHGDLFAVNDMKFSPDILLTKSLLQKAISNKRHPFITNFSLPFMHYHKKHMGDNIIIHVAMEDDRAKVTYIPKNYGMYEIIMISNGELIRGCPFNVHILNNTSGIEETLETEEKEEEIPHPRKRKVISKTIDFIDEQMPMADLQKRYNLSEKKDHEHTTNFKEVINQITKKKCMTNDIEKAKPSSQNHSVPADKNDVTYDDSDVQPTSKRDSFKMQQKQRKIDEEDEEDYAFSQEETDRDEIDFLKTNDNSLLDHASILEKQNVESVIENEKVKTQPLNTQDNEICSHEDMQKDDDILSYNAINNNILADSNALSNEATQFTDDTREPDENMQKECNRNIEGKLTFNEYPKPIIVNKIRIPEKFTELQKSPCKTTLLEGLDAKHVKNAISNKREIPRNLLRSTILQEDDVKRIKKTIENYPMLEPKIISNQTDDNDSGNDTISSLEDNEVKQNLVKALARQQSAGDIEKVFTVPKRFFQSQETLIQNSKNSGPSSERQSTTSPICREHIAHEVNEFKLMSVAEKRKIFANQLVKSVPQSTNSSFSENENVGVPNTPTQFQFEGLSVLNFLGSLKETENAKKSENYVLCSTKSLPNISSVEANYAFKNSVRERKHFWENLSSSSSSLSTNADFSPRRKPKKLTEEERIRLIWKKPNESQTQGNNVILEERTDLEKGSEMYKSADDILSIKNCISFQNPKKYKSLDNSLDNCTVLSIDERKKMLLQQNYEKERLGRERINVLKQNRVKVQNIKNIGNKKTTEEQNNNNDAIVFTPIVDKIKKYDSGYNLSKHVQEEEIKRNTITNKNKKISQTLIHNNLQDLPKPDKLTLKSHFKKAIKYFKNLEEKSLGKTATKTKFTKKDSRRRSLDIYANTYKNKRKGGSLNVPNVSERFSINNLYDDVFGSRRGSFKGAVNRSAVVQALATFSRKENAAFAEDADDDIKFDIFKKRAKSKKRKSVRSIFDVYY